MSDSIYLSEPIFCLLYLFVISDAYGMVIMAVSCLTSSLKINLLTFVTFAVILTSQTKSSPIPQEFQKPHFQVVILISEKIRTMEMAGGSKGDRHCILIDTAYRGLEMLS